MDEKSDKVHKKLLSLKKDIAKLTNELQEKNHALEIERALDEVRAKTMAMHRSDELKDVIQLVHDQLINLGIYAEHAGFILNYKENDKMHIWLADKNAIANEILIPYFDSPHWNSFNDAKAQGKNFFDNQLTFEEKNKFYTDLFKQVPELPEELLDTYLAYKGLSISTVLLDNIGLYIENFEGIPYSQEENNILMRFGEVFQQTYTRFLDLQKAEAQTREAEIELALERVRASSMAMYRSEELVEVATVLHNELKSLNVREFSETSIVVHDEPNQELIVWGARTGSGSLEKVVFPLLGDQILQKLYDTWRKKEDFFTLKIEGAALRKHIDFVFPKASRTALENEAIKSMPDPTFFHCAFFCMGYLELMADKELSQDSSSLLVRFARVFDQAYTRFLDLQKVEAQAREAQVEAALERVRARSMAMHNSNELNEVAALMYEQMEPLELAKHGCEIILCNEENDQLQFWSTNLMQALLPEPFTVSRFSHPFFRKQWKAWKQKQERLVITNEGKVKRDFDNFIFTKTDFRKFPDHVKKFIHSTKKDVFTHAIMKFGFLEAIDEAPLSEEKFQVLKRFANVFEQTYTRFLDLQKAEAQARDAQIEAALERLRAASMAMHHSEELSSTSLVMFQEIVKLGIRPWNFAFFIFHGQSDIADCFSSDQTGFYPTMVLSHKPDQFLKKTYEDWRANKKLTVQEAKGRALKKHQEYMKTIPGFDQIIKQRRTAGIKTLKKMIFNIAHFKYGYIMINTLEPQPDFWDILQRIAKVFEQTYTRFLDLKKAEAQAREAEIETALERLRAASMAMHHSEELTSTSLVMFQEIVKLGIRPWNFAFFIFHGQSDIADCFASDQTGSLPTMVLPHKPDKFLRKTYEDWRANKTLTVQEAKGRALKIHQEYMKTIPGFDQIIKQRNTAGVKTLKKMIFNNAHFKYGYIMINTLEPYTDFWDILQRIAKVFEQTFTRFLDLKKAEAQAREAEIEIALERVRSKSMAMRKSEELADLSFELVKQVQGLGVATWFCAFNIYDDDEKGSLEWGSNGEGTYERYRTPREGIFLRYFEAGQRGDVFLVNEIGEDECPAHYEYLCSLTGVGEQLLQMKDAGIPFPTSQIDHVAFFKYGYILFITFDPEPESHDIFKRFAKVFEQTYTRFLDLKKAEDQARITEEQNKKLAESYENLKATQSQLIQAEKMASLGELTAGIAHEIQNPLNFVNNFSEVSAELAVEAVEELNSTPLSELTDDNIDEVKEILNDLVTNLQKITHHGGRASGIVKGMLAHSRSGKGENVPTDINALCDEYLRLTYHGLRAKDSSFNAKMETDFDDTIGEIDVIPQDIGRVLLNLITNAFQACGADGLVKISTKKLEDKIEVSVQDNGSGIPDAIKDKIFQPFFTTKDTGKGTGLGLSLAYDIVKAHGGELTCSSKVNEGTEFIIRIPIASQ